MVVKNKINRIPEVYRGIQVKYPEVFFEKNKPNLVSNVSEKGK